MRAVKALPSYSMKVSYCHGHAILVHGREEYWRIDHRRLPGGRNGVSQEK
jgi:hypothetical protein